MFPLKTVIQANKCLDGRYILIMFYVVEPWLHIFIFFSGSGTWNDNSAYLALAELGNHFEING